jgi:hypothetical protein
MKKVQTLNEEIQKMRRLMSFNINENSHDSLSEENFDKSTKGENTDPLQKECGGTYSGPSEIADKMSVKLNKLIDAKLIELQKQIKVNIIAMGPTNTRLEFGDISLPFKENQQYYKTYNFTESSNIPFASDIPVSLFKEELLNSDECFRMVYDRYDSVKNQIDGGVIKMELVPATERFVDMVGNMSIKMVFVNSSRKLKREIKKMSMSSVVCKNYNNWKNFRPKRKPEINRIIYCYSKWQVGYDILKEKIKSIEFFEGSIFNNQQAFEIPRMKQDLNFQ